MKYSMTETVMAVIAYAESHLSEKPDLEEVSAAVCYSKYYLHRMVTKTLGMTLHDYIRRRRLTEAARLLVCSQKPILEIALAAGYESQQAFTGIFKSMYKQSPLKYRENGKFYPLQLRFCLCGAPSRPDAMTQNIACVTPEEIPDWMGFAALVIDGFPCFEEADHLRRLAYHIEQKQAWIMRDKHTVVGAAAFSRQAASIDFLAVHPQYRGYGIEKTFLDFIVRSGLADREISITTFRDGDRADTGQRVAYKRLGFVGAELLTEFGYPVQRLVLQSKREVILGV